MVNHNHPLNLIIITWLLQVTLPTSLLKWKVTHICHRVTAITVLLISYKEQLYNLQVTKMGATSKLREHMGLSDIHAQHGALPTWSRFELRMQGFCSEMYNQETLAITKRSGIWTLDILLTPHQRLQTREGFLCMTKTQADWNADLAHLRSPQQSTESGNTTVYLQ